jgi:hypothetical protein
MNSNVLASITPLRRKLIDNLQLWRALDAEDIKNAISYKKSNRGLRKLLQATKDIGLISSKKIGPLGRDYYFLNRSVHNHFVESQGPVNDKEVYHDVLTSKFVMNFVKTYRVDGFDISPDFCDQSILAPDATISVEFSSGVKNIAIEMELTRKSIKRYLGKFKSYNNSKKYDLALYVFNDVGIFNSYKERLNQDIKNLMNCRVILVLNTTLNLEGIDIKQSTLFAFGKDHSLEDFFIERGARDVK